MEDFSDQKRCFLQVYTWSSRCEGHFITRNHDFFDLNFDEKIPPYGFLAPCPIRPKCRFGQVILTSIVLIGSLCLVFLLGFYLPNHHDNIIWLATKTMYYFIN